MKCLLFSSMHATHTCGRVRMLTEVRFIFFFMLVVNNTTKPESHSAMTSRVNT